MGQCQASERFTNVPKLGADGAKKSPSNGGVIEQISNFDASSRRSVPRTDGGNRAALTRNLGPAACFRGPGLKSGLRNPADAGQRFSPEAQRADSKEIVGTGQFTGGMTGKSQRKIIGRNAATIVDHSY